MTLLSCCCCGSRSRVIMIMTSGRTGVCVQRDFRQLIHINRFDCLKSERNWFHVQGVNTAAQAAAAAGVRRVLLISSLFVSEKHGRNPLRIMLNTVRWRMMDNKVLLFRPASTPGCLLWPNPWHDHLTGNSIDCYQVTSSHTCFCF